MKIRKIRGSEIDFLWNFEKENRGYDRKLLGEKFKPFYISDTNEGEKKSWLEEVKKAFQKNNVLILVAEEKGHLIGYIWVKTHFLNYLKPKKKVGYINELFVKKEFRGKGVSSKLMEKVLDWFKGQRIGFVSLGVFAQNSAAINLYKKFGFELFYSYMRKKL